MFVKVSGKWLSRLCCCQLDYILSPTGCRGRCCLGKVVAVLPRERAAVQEAGGHIVDNVLLPNFETGRCPFLQPAGLCKLHNTGIKPLHCTLHPFKFNSRGTLVAQKSWFYMSCANRGMPLYEAFSNSLAQIFPDWGNVKRELVSGALFVRTWVDPSLYTDLQYIGQHTLTEQRKRDAHGSWANWLAEAKKEHSCV